MGIGHGVEMRAGDIGHAHFGGGGQELGGIETLRQLHPQEDAAIRTGVLDGSREGGEHLLHLGHLLAVAFGDLPDMIHQNALAQIRIHNGLIEVGGMHIGGLLADDELAHQGRLGADRRRHAQTGRDDLGEAIAVDDAVGGVKRLDGGQRLTRIAQVAIRIVLDQHHAGVTGDDLRHGLAALQASGCRQWGSGRWGSGRSAWDCA